MRTPRISRSARTLVALALVAGASLPVPSLTRAQGLPASGLPAPGDGFEWERVGDRPIDAYDLAFGPDATLWATGVRSPYRLDLTGGFPGVWVATNGVGWKILPLGRGPQGDTLLVVTAGSVRRSLDGGQTWVHVHERGGGGIYEVPEGYPYAGRVLVSAADGFAGSIAYSDDRGASFTEGVVPGPGGNYAHAEDFAALPPGSPYAGRILAAGRWGVNISDDGGETFRESGLWEVLYYVGERIGAVEEPAGSAVMGGFVNAQPLARAWTSADEGETWAPDGGGQSLPEGPPNGAWGVKGVLSLGDPSALVVLHAGTVYRTDDAGETWAPVGRAPDISSTLGITARSAAVGPDGRLYVGLGQAGVPDAWVYRTAERLTLPPVGVTLTATSPSRLVTIPPSGGSLPLRVTLTNPADEAQTVTAGTAVHLPDGTPYGPLLTRAVTLPAGASVTAALTQHVPAQAPAGRYRYVAFVGEWPDGLAASEELAFVKQAGVASRDAAPEAWSAPVVEGLAGEEASAVGPGEGLGVEVVPNPARGTATVALTLPEVTDSARGAGAVSVAVYDVLGRRVLTVASGRLAAGRHEIPLDASALPPGVYVVRVAAGSASASRAVTLLR